MSRVSNLFWDAAWHGQEFGRRVSDLLESQESKDRREEEIQQKEQEFSQMETPQLEMLLHSLFESRSGDFDIAAEELAARREFQEDLERKEESDENKD